MTGGSLILAIVNQNFFVIEHIKKEILYLPLPTICTVSDILLIFLCIFIYHTGSTKDMIEIVNCFKHRSNFIFN